MKPRTHRCAAVGCQHSIPLHLLMCVDHWRMVPVALRREVTQTFRDATRNLSATGLALHLHAVTEAVAALQSKQIDKNNARSAVEGDLFGPTLAATGEQQPTPPHGLLHRRIGRGEPGGSPVNG